MAFWFRRPKNFNLKIMEKNLFNTEEAASEAIENELASLRQKCTALALEGQYETCLALIEEKLAFFYQYERWPQSFFQLLRLHKRCYPPNSEIRHIDYMVTLLRKNDIPAVFADLLAERDGTIVWSAEHFRTMALLSQGRGEWETALDYSELVIRMEPASSGAYVLRGQLWDAAGHPVEAIAMYKQALALSPSNHHASVNLARHFLQKNPTLALQYIDSAIEKKSGDAGYLALKVSILLKMNRKKEALETCDQAIELDPYDAELPYQKAEILLQNGQTVAAISQYKRVLALDSKHLQTLLRLAELNTVPQPELALQYITTAVGLQPQNCDASLLRANLLQHFGELDAAIAQYELVLTLDPACIPALGGLADIYLKKEKWQRALDYFNRALLSPTPSAAHYLYGKAQAHVQLKQNEQAIPALQKSIELDDTNAGAYALLGAMYEKKDPEFAVACYQHALEREPENVDYLSACGILLQQMNQMQQALLLFERAVKLARGDAQVHIYFAKLLEQTGNVVSAAAHYQIAYTLQPQCFEARFGLARMYSESDPVAALLHIHTAMEQEGLNSEIYYWKAKILLALTEKPNLLERLESVEDAEHLDADELQRLYLGQGRTLALRYLNRAVELVPDRVDYLLEQANLLLNLQAPQHAESIYEKILKKQPENASAILGLARALAAQNKEEAIDHYDRAVQANPQHPIFHAYRAQFLSQNPDTFAQALAGFDKAIALAPRSWEIMLEKAKLLDKHQSVREACQYYRRVLLLNINCLEAATRMGILLSEILPHASLEYFVLALQLEPENYRHHIWRGKVLWKLNQPLDAQSAFDMARVIGQNRHEVHFDMADILQDILPDQAMEYCLQAHEKKPEEPEYNRLLGDLYLAQNQVEQAVQYYDKVLEYETLHPEALEKLAYILYLQQNKASLERVEQALEQRPDCLRSLHLKAKILDELYEDTEQAIACISQAVKLAPEVLEYREMRMQLYAKGKQFLRMYWDRIRLKQLRHKLSLPISEDSVALPQQTVGEKEQAEAEEKEQATP